MLAAHYRARAARRQPPAGEEVRWDELPDPLARRPEDWLEQRAQLDALSRAIGELTDRQREVFAAIALNDVPIDVLATKLGANRNMIYKNLFDARRSLRGPMAAAGHAVSGAALGTAGSAVVFAGGTVLIALAGLAVVGIPFLTMMGFSAAGAVAIAVLVALTLLPAVVGFAGHRLTPKPDSRAARRERPGTAAVIGERWARFVTRHPLRTVAVVIVALLVLAIPALSLRLALADNGSAATNTTQRQAYDLISAEFGPGFNGPLTLLVHRARRRRRRLPTGLGAHSRRGRLNRPGHQLPADHPDRRAVRADHGLRGLHGLPHPRGLPRDQRPVGGRNPRWQQASRIVTAAALIMFSVFASFVGTPDATLKTIAFGLGVGILVDAFVVRMTLVPAALALLGDKSWWLPRRLDRALPNLDVETAALQEAPHQM